MKITKKSSVKCNCNALTEFEYTCGESNVDDAAYYIRLAMECLSREHFKSQNSVCEESIANLAVVLTDLTADSLLSSDAA